MIQVKACSSMHREQASKHVQCHPDQTFATRPIPTRLPNQFPLPLILHATSAPFSPSPTHPPKAATTALRSSLGTRIQHSFRSTWRISTDIADPLRPRN